MRSAVAAHSPGPLPHDPRSDPGPLGPGLCLFGRLLAIGKRKRQGDFLPLR
jgi:hypothetical protein